MPTYDFKCPECGRAESLVMTISQYVRLPEKDRPTCHGPMERHLSVVPSMSGLANALAGDRHYDGLRAPDGTDISSRTKHREYMKANNLSLAGDYTDTWAKKLKEREAFRTAAKTDAELKTLVKEQVEQAVSK
jgi:putative FmdB family regulatory protein